VRHDVRIFRSGINIWLRFLIWLVMRTGKPSGKTHMERFRELVESEEAPAAAVQGLR
jgi:hypothetical protein